MEQQEMIAQIMQVISHPEMEKLIREIENQPEHKRLEYATQEATIDRLRRNNVPLTDQHRICIRYFEDPENPSEQFDLIGSQKGSPFSAGLKTSPFSGIEATAKKPKGKSWTICTSLGYFVCISYGITREYFPLLSANPGQQK